ESSSRRFHSSSHLAIQSACCGGAGRGWPCAEAVAAAASTARALDSARRIEFLRERSPLLSLPPKTGQRSRDGCTPERLSPEPRRSRRETERSRREKQTESSRSSVFL